MGRTTDLERVDLNLRRERAARLRVAGKEWCQVYDLLLASEGVAHGYPDCDDPDTKRSRVRRDVGRYLAVNDDPETVRKELRALHLARTESMFAALWTAITDGDGSAIRTGLAVLERQAKAFGVDDPVQVEILSEQERGELIHVLAMRADERLAIEA